MNFTLNIQKMFLGALTGTIVLVISLQIVGSNLITPVSPLGIVSFEFSSNLKNATAIMNSWSDTGKIFAGLDLGLDYLFIILYASTLISGCILVMDSVPDKKDKLLGSLSKLMIAGAIIAALLDAIENFALIKILTGNGSEMLASLAIYCAVPKFIIVGIVILFIISGWSYRKIFSPRSY